MPATLLAILLFSTSFPSTSLTSWMRPESFHLRIGMARGEAVRALQPWHPKPGKDANEMVIDVSGEKALTLEFKEERLRSVRFELFAFLPQVRKAFTEEKTRLRETRGKPRRSTKAVLIYDQKLPNVMVVLADSTQTKQGMQGIGMLAVRYYEPAAISIPSSPAPVGPASPPASH